MGRGGNEVHVICSGSTCLPEGNALVKGDQHRTKNAGMTFLCLRHFFGTRVEKWHGVYTGNTPEWKDIEDR